MKRRSLLLLLLPVSLLMAGMGLWVRSQQRQYALNRQLIAALINNDRKQAFALANAGADPNTRFNTPPAPTLKLLLSQLLHRSSAPVDTTPTAFMFACGTRMWTRQTEGLSVLFTGKKCR